MKKLNVYVVDDDVFYLKSVIMGLNPEYSHSVNFHYLYNANELLVKLKNDEDAAYVFLDYNLDMSDRLYGVELIKEIKKINPKTEIVIVSSQNNNQTALSVIKAGALSYIQKDPDILKNIRSLLNKALKVEELKKGRGLSITLMIALFGIALLILCFMWFKK
jgi:DNA-binding NtrC family response regulator